TRHYIGHQEEPYLSGGSHWTPSRSWGSGTFNVRGGKPWPWKLTRLMPWRAL
ncbi:hypothetical protein KXV31_005443, partial [Aspergillus fumigatus]